MSTDKALIAITSAFSRPVATAMKRKKSFVLTIKPLSSNINTILN